MKKKYIKAIIIVATMIILSIFLDIFVYVKVSGKPINNIYYKNITIRNTYGEDYLEGYIINKTEKKYEDLYVSFVIENNNEEFTFELLCEKSEDSSRYFKNNVTSEDFMVGEKAIIKKVFIKNGFEGELMQIYNKEYLAQHNLSIYAPFYAVLSITILLIIGLLIISNFYANYKSKLHSVSKSIYNTPSKKVNIITCPYCGYTTSEIMDKCPKCNANILKNTKK